MLAKAIGKDWKDKVSPLLYIAAIVSIRVSPWIAGALYVLVALKWLIPDKRIERVLQED